MSEARIAVQAQWDPVADPASNCELPGLVRQAIQTPHPVRVIQNDDHVILEYEEYGGRRIIHLDGREPPSAEHTNFGHSVGYYEGNSLVVETTQLLANWATGVGVPLSDQTTTVESFRRMDDPRIGPVLSMEMVV